jgi:hypothetical protein
MEHSGTEGVNLDMSPRIVVAAFAVPIVAVILGACAMGENPNVIAARNICTAAYGDTQLDPIRGRIPFGDDQATMASMAQLADTAKPNNVERAILQQYDAANRRCWDAWDKAGTSPYIQQARANVSAALAELVTGQNTYGDFNRKRASAIAEMNARLREAEERQRAAYYNRGPMFCDAWGRGPYTTLHCF